MNKELFVTATIIAAVAGLLLIGGCSKQPQQQPETQSPQIPEQAQPQHDLFTEKGQSKTEENDLYKDNLNGSIDDLSQLEQ